MGPSRFCHNSMMYTLAEIWLYYLRRAVCGDRTTHPFLPAENGVWVWSFIPDLERFCLHFSPRVQGCLARASDSDTRSGASRSKDGLSNTRSLTPLASNSPWRSTIADHWVFCLPLFRYRSFYARSCQRWEPSELQLTRVLGRSVPSAQPTEAPPPL